MKTLAICYAAVRAGEFGDWAPLDEIQPTPDLVTDRVERTAGQIPAWHAAHPVQRIARVQIVELDTVGK